MEYTIRQLCALSGVTARTLRYYDEIGLLRPARTTAAGYRIYGEHEIDLLQQILFYRALDFSLEEIRRLLQSPEYDREETLCRHLDTLRARQVRLNLLIQSVHQTLASIRGGTPMSDQEKFTAFKKRIVAENEQAHGAEVRTKYGDTAMDSANARVLGLSEEEYAKFETLKEEILCALRDAVTLGADPTGDVGRHICVLHREWLGYSWNTVKPQAHIGLAQMYLSDERFTAYYDSMLSGCAQFLCDAITHWAERLLSSM